MQSVGGQAEGGRDNRQCPDRATAMVEDRRGDGALTHGELFILDGVATRLGDIELGIEQRQLGQATRSIRNELEPGQHGRPQRSFGEGEDRLAGGGAGCRQDAPLRDGDATDRARLQHLRADDVGAMRQRDEDRLAGLDLQADEFRLDQRRQVEIGLGKAPELDQLPAEAVAVVAALETDEPALQQGCQDTMCGRLREARGAHELAEAGRPTGLRQCFEQADALLQRSGAARGVSVPRYLVCNVDHRLLDLLGSGFYDVLHNKTSSTL